MSKYIDREEALKPYMKLKDSDVVSVYLIKQTLMEQDSADVRENIHGEWIPKYSITDAWDVDLVCSRCGYVGIEGYAHGYELNELPVQEMKDYIKKFDMNYCTCCSAKMDKSESEDKK